MLAAQQRERGAPLGPNNAIVSTTKYLSTLAVKTLEACTSRAKPDAAAAALDLEQLAGISFPNVTQGSTNMCSAFAFCQAYSLRYALQNPDKAPVPRLSAVFAYYFQRIAECKQENACVCPKTNACDPPCLDCGSYMNTAQEVFAAGVCKSADWPYTTPLNTVPSSYAIGRSEAHRITKTTCVSVDTVSDTQRALREKCPVVVFVNLTTDQKTWMQAAASSTAASLTDVVLPPFSEGSATSGHFVVITGIHASRAFIARNSFGRSWGFEGRFLIPFANFTPQQMFRAVRIDTVV